MPNDVIHRMKTLLYLVFLLSPCIAFMQADYKEYHTQIDGHPVIIMVKDGDTLIIAQLEKAIVVSPRSFESNEERTKYMKYRRYAAVVYPYAVQAVRLYFQLLKETEGASDKERRKVVRQISQRLEDEFEKPLKNLTKTQGFLLTKMIERKLDKSFFDLTKELKGRFNAGYYNQLGKLYGYQLKEKYEKGKDPILDAVLEEFDLEKDMWHYGGEAR